MSERTLPNGDRVAPGDLVLHDGYPFRYLPVDSERYEFVLSPLFWGDSGMDVPFRDDEALAAQWSAESAGTLTDEEWAAWLADARDDDRFDQRELDGLAAELPVDGRAGATASEASDSRESGLLDRIRRRVLG